MSHEESFLTWRLYGDEWSASRCGKCSTWYRAFCSHWCATKPASKRSRLKPRSLILCWQLSRLEGNEMFFIYCIPL